MIIKRRGVFPETLESETMNTQSIYNGLDYTTREINRNCIFAVTTSRGRNPPAQSFRAMEKVKRYRINQAMYAIIQKANGGLFLLYTRHNPGDVLSLLLDGNDIGLICRVESVNDRYYKYCRVITV